MGAEKINFRIVRLAVGGDQKFKKGDKVTRKGGDVRDVGTVRRVDESDEGRENIVSFDGTIEGHPDESLLNY